MVSSRKKTRAGANPESPARTQPGKIYMKYALPDGQYSHGNRMNYSFNVFFNTLRKRRVMNCIIMFLNWIIL